jgi:hypothetical protein
MSEPKQPLYSKYEDDPDLMDEVSDFVIGLAEWVDELQDAECGGEFEQLGHLSKQLLEKSTRYGYPSLAESAENLRACCLEEKRDAAQETLLELTDISIRIRLGHRGAA